MKLPKLTRKQIYAAKGKAIEITVPAGEECRAGQSYALEGDRGGKRQATIFVDATERRGKVRYAAVRVIEEPRLLARQHGLHHPQQYTTSSMAAMADDAGEAVPGDYQRRLSEEGALKTVLRGAVNRDVLKAEEDVAKRRREGRGDTQAVAQLQRAQRRLDEAA